jgi:hypothetical protein
VHMLDVCMLQGVHMRFTRGTSAVCFVKLLCAGDPHVGGMSRVTIGCNGSLATGGTAELGCETAKDVLPRLL